MNDVIIDTNVEVLANRQNSKVVQDCIDACIQFIIMVRTDRVVLIDDGDEIRAEYARALRQRRPYELGAQFLLHLYQQQHNPKHVRRVRVDKAADGSFTDFPDVPELAAFDQADRKFAALARKTGVAVTNAADSDWADSLAALSANGIAVDFLCGCDKTKWFIA